MPHLYETLQAQTFRDFEWLIVDDGSSDNTENLIQGWINDARLPIRYIKTPNGGKHRAINKGLALAKGDLFFIVDSDDWLPVDSLYWIDLYYSQICSCVHKIKGDMAEVWRTHVLRQYLFPEFEGEKFLTEALVWNKIALKYKLRYFNKEIYTCEYLPDGLTNNIRIHHRNSPRGTMLFYSELTKDNRFSWVSRMKAAANYWRYTMTYKGRRNHMPLWAFLLLPIGFMAYRHDLRKERQ